jgi:ribosomal-protein-alanine N-acetyltransferase
MTMAESARDVQVTLEPMLAERLDAVVAIEQRAYAHPWNRTNFLDALQSGNQALMLVAGDVLLGYFVAMPGVDEVHLLNITVAPEYQGQGWSRIMLDALTLWARAQSAKWVWLEVRAGNVRALHVYTAHGYQRIGQRKDYYPAGQGRREDAVVMGLRLNTESV